MDFKKYFMIAYFNEEVRICGENCMYTNDFVDTYLMGEEL